MDEIQLALEELRRQILDQIPPEQILERLSVKERTEGFIARTNSGRFVAR